MLEIQNIVRARVLELTMKIAKEIPGAEEATISKSLKQDKTISEKVSQVFHTTVYGPHTVVTSTGSNNEISVQNISGDLDGLKRELVKSGVPEKEANEFSKLVSEEIPDENQSLGDNAIAWIASKLPVIAKGAWGITSSVATSVLEEAAKKFYGLS